MQDVSTTEKVQTHPDPRVIEYRHPTPSWST